MGHSFGGGHAAHFAQDYPEQVQTLTLLEPVFVLSFPSVTTLFWGTVGSLEFLPKSWRNYGLAQMTGEQVSDITSDDSLTRMIQAATTYYSSEVPPPKG